MKIVCHQIRMIRSFIFLTLSLITLSSCSDHKPCYTTTAQKFLDCIARKNTSEISRYTTEVTAKLIERLFEDMQDTLCYEEFEEEQLCPGFRSVIQSIKCRTRINEDGSFDWPRIARDSLSTEGLRAWVWLEYPAREATRQYRMRLIRVDDRWLVDLPILD